MTAPKPPWDGPTTGPQAEPGKTIVYASADQRNGDARGADAIVPGAIDATEQAAAVGAAAAEVIVVVGWHATASSGPSESPPLFSNITTDPLAVARAAASYVIADSDGSAGVVIFTDSVYEIAIAKSDAMAAVIESCGGCEVLALEDTPLSDVTARMPPQRLGGQRQRGRLPAHPHRRVPGRHGRGAAPSAWLVVDEIDRAFAGEAPSNYVAPTKRAIFA